jgi:hypothetical protein
MKTLLLTLLLLAGCASGPVAPDWQMNAHGALAASTSAYLEGNERLAQTELARARSEISRTARPDLLARAELTHCAALVASLELGPCAGYDVLERDAGPAERAYADFLAGRWDALDAAALPPQYRALLAAKGDASAYAAMTDPLSRLVAAGVLLRMGRLTPAGIDAATDVASIQGWRRPLLAWLGLQAQRAGALGDTDSLQRLQRRLALLSASKP